MAENDQYEDEYQFSDLDSIGTDIQDDSEYENSENALGSASYAPENNIKRNALIAVGIVVLLMILYKFFGTVFSNEKSSTASGEKQSQSSSLAQNNSTNTSPSKVSDPINQPSSQPSISNQTMSEKDVDRKLSTIDVSQQSLRSDVDNLSNQVQQVNGHLTEMSGQMAELNRMISALNTKINEQNQDMERLRAQLHHKKRKKLAAKPSKPPEIFHIQALIPGRAWLNSSHGTTITVRVGSKVPGYGTVKLIDPHQSRVLTSSGKIILFDHHDS